VWVLALGVAAAGFSAASAAQPQAAGPQGQTVKSGPIVSVGTNKCVDVPSNTATKDGANVQQYDCSGQPNQTWQLVQVGPDTYAIVNQGSRLALDVAGQSKQNAAAVNQYHWAGQPTQTWRLQPSGTDTFMLVNSGSGKCLDVANRSAANGATIQQYDCSPGAPNQTWRIGSTASAAAPIPATPVTPSTSAIPTTPVTPAGAQSGGLGSNVSSPQQEQAEKAVQIVQGPALKPLGGNSMELQWKTNNVAANDVKYGTDPNNLTLRAYESGGGRDHSVTLKNLTPGQTYYYQILTRDGDVRYTGQFQSQ
jgi:hypothetical protein